MLFIIRVQRIKGTHCRVVKEMVFFTIKSNKINISRSMAGSVVQATGRTDFDIGLRMESKLDVRNNFRPSPL